MPILPQMLTHEIAIIEAVNRHEKEFGRPLPANSFYKSLALDILRRYGLGQVKQ